jgi:hypothetical protein
MKKIVILTLCVFMLVLGTKAFADELLCGTLYPVQVNVWESSPFNDVPVAPCDLQIFFITENGQGPYILPATAFGTQLNVSLVKALNFGDILQACLIYNVVPPDGIVFRVRDVTFFGEIPQPE